MSTSIPHSPFPIPDMLGRPLGSLRLSVTDRCNMRCGYCMPEREYIWLPRESLLTFEELDRLVGVFAGLGAMRVRLTGGEPLLRHDLPSLVRMLSRRTALQDLALTTNGILLGGMADALRAAGLRRVTVSLDTLRPERMLAFARSARHPDVLDGIAAAQAAGFDHIKLNTVVIQGFNDDEIVNLLEHARAHDLEIRYIEYMDVGGATRWRRDDVGLARGHSQGHRRAVRRAGARSGSRASAGSRGALQAQGRHLLRHHCIGDRTASAARATGAGLRRTAAGTPVSTGEDGVDLARAAEDGDG